jgi:hypothetical protein
LHHAVIVAVAVDDNTAAAAVVVVAAAAAAAAAEDYAVVDADYDVVVVAAGAAAAVVVVVVVATWFLEGTKMVGDTRVVANEFDAVDIDEDAEDDIVVDEKDDEVEYVEVVVAVLESNDDVEQHDVVVVVVVVAAAGEAAASWVHGTAPPSSWQRRLGDARVLSAWSIRLLAVGYCYCAALSTMNLFFFLTCLTKTLRSLTQLLCVSFPSPLFFLSLFSPSLALPLRFAQSCK